MVSLLSAQVARHPNGVITLFCSPRDNSLPTFTNPPNAGFSIIFIHYSECECVSGVPAFVSVQSRPFDDSFSLNNIKRRCEMISDSACCLSLCSVSRLSQHLITRTLLCCQENVTKRGGERRERKRENEQRKGSSLGRRDNSTQHICGDDSPGTSCGFLELIE